MKLIASRRIRTGFTITELLVAMALLVFVMAIISESFSAGTANFRNLKAIGDMAERLRTTATALRRDLADTHFESARFIRESLLVGAADPEEAAALREQYEDFEQRAAALDVELAQAEELLRKPGDLRIVRRVRTDLQRLKELAATMVRVLRLMETGRPPDNDLPG
jgi:prepilin-type N-terminal cleavage/methylation domain-containing protein